MMRGVCREEAGLMWRRVQSYFWVPDVQQDYAHIHVQCSANARLQGNNPIHIPTFNAYIRGTSKGKRGRTAWADGVRVKKLVVKHHLPFF